MRIKFVILSIVLFGMCCACSEKSHFDEPRPEITVILGLSGAGDNGYNDEILAGIMDINESADVSLSMISPASMDDARSALSTWLNKELSGVNALLVLAGNEYESLIQDITLPQNKSILIFESEDDNLPNRVSSFMIHRYGVSYLAGCMASEAESASVIAAMRSENYLGDAVNGFVEGFSVGGNKAEVIYLAEDESGYGMPDEGYKIVSRLPYNSFIYPLAGGSNSGMYKATREEEFNMHEEIAQKLEIKFYFCKPYHSWERGANENTNGLIRQYIPKGKDFSEVTNKQIKWIENKLNNRPRKRLGYLTPNEKFKQIINQNSVAFAS